MRLLLLFIFFTMSLFAMSQYTNYDSRFELDGIVRNQDSGSISLTILGKGISVIKYTSPIVYGKFQFEGNISQPLVVWLRGDVKSLSDDDPNAVSFYLEPGKVHIILEKDNFKNARITGSKSQMENEELNTKFKNLNHDSAGISEVYDSIEKAFIHSHISSYVSIFELRLYLSRWPVDTVRSLFNLLDPEIKTSLYGQEVNEKIYFIERSLEGNKVQNFSSLDINGHLIALHNFIGKYVLLNFWASWCLPCRAENPELIKIFNKYHSRGLEIISIADDDNTVREWKDAISNDSTSIWYHLLRGLNNESSDSSISKDSPDLYDLYGISTIPVNILINKSGRIVYNSKYSDKKELSDVIGELFR